MPDVVQDSDLKSSHWVEFKTGTAAAARADVVSLEPQLHMRRVTAMPARQTEARQACMYATQEK